LRAAATNREIAIASAERDAGLEESHERDEGNESADTTREVRDTKPARSGS
jgi:hypothetical protein